jgi:uncharacterized membrane protein YqiK
VIMISPAASLAVIILCLFILVALVCWFFKSQIRSFVQALVGHRQKVQQGDSGDSRV